MNGNGNTVLMFRQKMGEVYSFDAIAEGTYGTSRIATVLVNLKTGKYDVSLIPSLGTTNAEVIQKMAFENAKRLENHIFQ